MIDPQNIDRKRPAVVRRLREALPSIAEILHIRIDDAIDLIKAQNDVMEAQAKEIARLKVDARHQAATEWEVIDQGGQL